jgi:uncharacterized protein YacL (UPF0231 family)
MDIVIDDVNYKQVTQAMYENVKSNEHRLDEIEPVINKMAKQVDRLDHMMVGNGFAKAVKENTVELKEFRKEFQDFKLNRATTCPVAKNLRGQKQVLIEKRDWGLRVGLAILSVAGFGLSFYIGVILGG